LLAAVEPTAWLAVLVGVEVWGRLDHFTWWGVIFHTWSTLTNSCKRSNVAVQCVVVAGVWFMSAAGCGMLKTAAEEAGTLMYALGNFAVHYVPLTSALARLNTHSPSGPEALLLWIVYVAYVHNPETVYECSAVHRSVPTVLGTIVASCASLA